MNATSYVTVEHVDVHGNYTREKLTLNDAVLYLLRFARKHPHSVCTIELREVDPVLQGCSPLNTHVQVETVPWSEPRTPLESARETKTDGE